MTEPTVTYKRKKYYDNTKKKLVVKKKFGSDKIIDNRPAEKGQEFDGGPKFRWQKIKGKVRCPKCKIIYQINKLPEYWCPWCGKLIWIEYNLQRNNYMLERD